MPSPATMAVRRTRDRRRSKHVLRSPRALASALAIATLWIGFNPTGVTAECFPRVPDATPLTADFAFTATVTAVATEPDEKSLAAGEGDGSLWRVELLVERVHRGDVPSGSIVWTGHTLRHLSCNNDLLGERLHPGERLFVAIEDQFAFLTAPEPYGRVLLWKSDGGRWTFYDEALADDVDVDAGPYPRAARDANTTQAILAAISGRIPDTATESAAGDDDRVGSGTGRLALLLIAFTITFLLAFGLGLRGGRRSSRAGDIGGH
jgi:hypothetical protein